MLMGMTMGEILFYGGIAGTAFFGLLFVLLWFIYEGKKKRLIKKIEQELSKD